MSTIIATTLSNGTVSVPTATVVNGSAKAWVNFNGTGTIAARGSFNVASLTDNGTGDYTVSFTSAMIDADYSVALAGQGFQLGDVGSSQLSIAGGTTNYASPPTLMSSSQLRITFGTDSFLFFDVNRLTVAIFR